MFIMEEGESVGCLLPWKLDVGGGAPFPAHVFQILPLSARPEPVSFFKYLSWPFACNFSDVCYYSLCVSMHSVYMWTSALCGTCGGQRSTLFSQFSTFCMWTLRIKLGVKLFGKCPYLLTHLTDPHFLLCLASLPFYLFTVFCLYTFRHSLQGLGESLSLSDTSLIFQALFSKWHGFNNLIFQVYSTLII